MTKYAMCDGSLVDIDNYSFNYDIEVVAHHLAKIQRFGGAAPIDVTYSVAEHSINLANFFLNHSLIQENLAQYGIDPRICAFYALIHDASEAYLGDMVSGLKEWCTTYKIIESNFERILKRCLFYKYLPRNAYAFVQNAQKYVHLYDKRIVLDEVQVIMPEKYKIYKQEINKQPIGCGITYDNRPSHVKSQFLKLYKELANDR